MRLIDIIQLSTRMFKARTSRTLLTVLGMSIGIAAILFLVSLGYGLQKTLLEKITTSESLLTLDISEAKSGIVSLNNEILDKIKVMDGIEEVSPAFQITAQGHLDGLSAELIIMAAQPSFLRLGGFSVDQGKTLTDENNEGVVISSAAAQVFGKNVDEMIGKKIKFTFFVPQPGETNENDVQRNLKEIKSDKEYEVLGIIKEESNTIYVNSASLGELKIDKYNQVKVKCKNSEKMSLIRDEILESGLFVSSLSDTVEQANKIFQVIQIILMLFGVVALVVSAIGMFNTMTIALLERTEEIGIMKSIGASGLAISLMFIMEATIMGLLGGIVGIILGISGGEFFNFVINFISSRFGGEPVRLFAYPAALIIGILIGSVVVGAVTGLVPARRASKIDPLDALRYK